jgi:SAM-dependent methyltransferase
MAGVKPYYARGSLSAAFYDVVTAADAKLVGDVEVYLGLAGPGAKVLELGVGSGRIAFGLAAHGCRVTGVDLAPAMLEQAAARRAALPPDARERLVLMQGDMTALDLKTTFEVVLCPYFALAHLPLGAAWRNTFAVAARHLTPGGLAAFHLPRLDVMRGLRTVDPEAVVLDQPAPGGRRLQLRLKSRAFRADIGRLEQVIDYAELDAAGRFVRRSAERLAYYMADPEPVAAGAGLALDRPPIPLNEIGDIWIFRKP